jgi:hypothetical protein
VVGRRFGDDHRDLLDEKEDLILLFPSANNNDQEEGDPPAMSLDRGLELFSKRRTLQTNSETTNTDEIPCSPRKITVIVLDATWKYAKEMHLANLKDEIYPKHMIKVTLQPTISQPPTTATTVVPESTSENIYKEVDCNDDNGSNTPQQPSHYKPRRFDIRTPPNDDCLSTAECIAWVAAAIDSNPQIYTTLMKPLDLMVSKWNSFVEQKGGARVRNNSAVAAAADEGQSAKRARR